MTTLEKVNYRGWENCYRLSNGQIDLIVTTDVGPRIIHFGFTGGENEFAVFDDTAGRTDLTEWRPFGGHRLWHAPEVQPRTYSPDNSPVQFAEYADFVRLIQPVEPDTGIQKEIDIYLLPDDASARIVHRLRNTGVWPVQLAVWSLSQMAQNGVAILPLPPRVAWGTSLLPSSTIAIWTYTAMSDERWTWGHKYILLRQDPHNTYSQKAGLATPEGWIAYVRNNHLFVTLFNPILGATYPDMGCTIETYTDANTLELETLGPLVVLEPQVAVEHTEYWHLFDNIPMPAGDNDVDTYILPKVESAKRRM